MLADQLETWSGCYDESWGEFITPESFCHPAKMSYGLVEKIVKHGFERGYWKVNDLIGDPFSGVGCVGIMAAAHGLRYIGCELEPKFHALSELNLQLNPWCRNGVCRAVCGDSRNFASLIGQCDTVVTSAPFAGSDNRGGTKMPDGYFDVTGGIRTSDDLVPQSPGQLASLPVGDLSSVICSPPYAESITGSHGERESAEDSRDARRTDGGSLGQSQRHGGYGITEGQIGAMPAGELASVLTSRFDDVQLGYASENKLAGSGTSTEILGGGIASTACGRDEGISLDHTETSSQVGLQAYREGSGEATGEGGTGERSSLLARQEATTGDGGTAGGGDQRSEALSLERRKGTETVPQVGKKGEMRTLRCPSQSRDSSQGLGPLQQCAGESSSAVPVVSHERSQEGTLGCEKGGVADAESQRPGELETCSAIVTSPPWETSEPQQDKSFRAPHDSTLNLAKSDYGSTNGQLGKTSGPTYWGAVKTIYEQCLLALKPGGVICVVMGNFVRAGEIVDLCGDTWTLLQHVGFTPLERIKALKTTTTEHAGLFEPIKKTKSKVSFFRRLSINRGSPDPGGEQVLFLRKPGL